MNKAFRELLIKKVGKELNRKEFYLMDLGYKNIIHFRRKTDSYIEIVQFSKDKYQTCITVASSIVFLDEKIENSNLNWKEKSKKTNINYPFLNEYCDGNIDKIGLDECCRKYYLKGTRGNDFHYGDVYWDIRLGMIIGVSPQRKKKPVGFRISKFTDKTYDNLCNLIIKRLPKIYSWLEKQKNTLR